MVPWCMTAWTEQSWTAWRGSCLLNLYDSPAGSGAQPGFGVPLSRDKLRRSRVSRVGQGRTARSAETARPAPETVPNRLRERAQPEPRPLGLAHVRDPRAPPPARAARARDRDGARKGECRARRAARGRATSAAVAGGVR